MRISDWSSDVCSSDLAEHRQQDRHAVALRAFDAAQNVRLGDVGDFVAEHAGDLVLGVGHQHQARVDADVAADGRERVDLAVVHHEEGEIRSEEHTSELQSLMRISYAVFCLKKK